MNYIDSHYVDHTGTDPRLLVLCSGSIASVPKDIDLQFLVISCAPHEYWADGNPFIQELEEMGISVRALEENLRLQDFRPSLPCWVSERMSQPSANFQYLVAWEPELQESRDNTLHAIPDACMALQRIAGHLGGSSAMFLAWPPAGNATAEDVFRMQFFAAAALAARSQWGSLYLMVPENLAAEASAWFAALKENYDDPPLHTRGHLSAKLRSALPVRLNQAPARHHDLFKLTRRQAFAIQMYTVVAYSPLNRALRRDDVRHPEFIVMQPLAEAVATGLAQFAPHDFDVTVERSVNAFEGIEDLYKDGVVTRELAFTSTTTLDLPEEQAWILHIRSILGRYIAKMSAFPQEDEVLFDSGLDHVVTDVTPDGEIRVDVSSHQRIPGSTGARETHL